MTTELARACRRSPFSSSTLSMAGMLACVFSCLAGLTLAAKDQTGRDLSVASASFRHSLSSFGQNSFSPVLPLHPVETRARHDEPGIRSASLPHRSKRPAENRVDFSESTEKHSHLARDFVAGYADADRAVFHHLLGELNRFCVVSNPSPYAGQFAVDYFSSAPQTDEACVLLLAKSIRSAQQQRGSASLQFELVTWAYSPDPAALSAAALNSENLRALLITQSEASRQDKTRIISSARFWTSRAAPRPFLTLVVRRSGR